MSLSFKCPECGHKLKVDESLAGRQGTCPKCGARCRIPGADQAEVKEVVSAGPVYRPRPGASVSHILLMVLRILVWCGVLMNTGLVALNYQSATDRLKNASAFQATELAAEAILGLLIGLVFGITIDRLSRSGE